MRKLWIGSLTLMFWICSLLSGQETEMQELKKKLSEQDKRIQYLENKLKDQTKQGEGVSQDQVDKMIEKYLDEKLTNQEKGFKLPQTLKNKWIQFGGQAKLNFIDYRQKRPLELGDPQSHFEFQEFRLDVKIHFNEYFTFYSALEFDKADDGTKVDQAYLEFSHKDLITAPNIKIGIIAPPYRFSRRTERYPIVGTAYFRDEEIGIHYQGSYEFFFWGIDFAQARELKAASVGRPDSSPSTKIIRETRHGGTDQNEHLVRLSTGIKKDFKKFGKLQSILFWEDSQLDEGDIDFLQEIPTYRGDDKDEKKNLWGVGLDYSLPTSLGANGSFFFQSVFFSDRLGEMSRHGYYAQVSHQWVLNYPFFYSIEPLFRYGRYQVQEIQTSDDPLSWDRDEYTIGLSIQPVKNVTFKAEYTFENAFSSGKDLDLDYLLLQLEVTF